MAKKVFVGSASIVLNTKGELALKKDPEGKFSAANAAECYETMLKLAKARKVSINKWSLFTPEGGTVPVMLADQFGNPGITLCTPRAEGGAKRTGGVIKLA